MAVVTVGQLLDRNRDLDAQLETYYAEIRDHSTDNSVRLVTYYLARHRRLQDSTLAGLDPDRLRRARQAKVKLDGPFNLKTKPRLLDGAPAAVRGDELIAAAVRYDSEWVDLYRSLLAQPLDEDGRAVLEALIRVEERDMVMLNKMLDMHYF